MRSLESDPLETQGFPIIELGSLDAGEEERQALARSVDAACRSLGFLAVREHGVPQAVQDAAWTAAREFFELAPAEKARLRSDDPDYPYGYWPMAAETLARSAGRETPPDLKESYSVAPPHRAEAEAGGLRTGPGLWPPAPTGFRDAFTAYYAEMEQLAARLMGVFAVALDLPARFFADKIDRHLSALRALCYPVVAGPPRTGQLRAGAHTDYGSLTILKTGRGQPGLEVQQAGRVWMPVPEVSDGFIVNIGDLMARWTNDRWRSTLHRVVVPSEPAGAPRQSLAFFHQPNWDAEIVALPSCTSAGDPARHPPVKSGPWLREKFRRAYGTY